MLLALCLTVGSAQAAQELPERLERPNVLLIVADDLGARDLGFCGSDFHETPHLDRLSTEGLVFTQAYAAAANCAPSRAALFSGLAAPRTGIFTVQASTRGESRNRRLLVPENETVLAPEFVTFAERLHEAGYRTGFFGKWHLGEGLQSGPLARGFDVNVGGNQRGHPRSYLSPYENPAMPDGSAGEHLTDRLAAEVAAFVAAEGDAPFLAVLSFYAVHTPLQPRPDRLERWQERPPGELHANPRYAALIEGLDEAVGQVMDTLARSGLDQSTLVLFTSDNGGHGGVTSQAPLRGAKGMYYEGGLRVPLIMRMPGRITPGSTAVPVTGLDVYPTVCELAGIPLAPEVVLDGASLLGPLDALRERELTWHFPAYLEAYQQGAGRWRTTPVGVLRKGRWKLLEFFEDRHLELYDLESDPGETRDLATSEVARRDKLFAAMQRWRARVGASVPTEPNPAYVPGHVEETDRRDARPVKPR